MNRSKPILQKPQKQAIIKGEDTLYATRLDTLQALQ